MLSRRLFAIATATGMLLLAASPVLADRISKKDPDDFDHRLDVRRVVHSHGGEEGRVRHKLASHETWRSRVLRKKGWRIAFFFSIDKNVHDAERRIVIRQRNGELHATYFAGSHATERQEADVRVRRPDRRSVSIAFDPDLFRDGIRAYRWWTVVYEWTDGGAAICDSPCTDHAPNSGSLRHELE